MGWRRSWWYGVGQARYPSTVANPDYPFAIWTEYTAITTFGSHMVEDLIILMMNLMGRWFIRISL